MKRRTVTVEVEFEGAVPDPLSLRDRIARLNVDGWWRVRRVEIVEELDDGR